MDGVILLSKAVKDILLKTKTPSSEYFRYLSLAAEAVTKLRLHVVSFPKQIRLSMGEAGVISFPSDMIGFISIGAALNGKLWTYTYEGDIVSTTTIEDGVEVPEEIIPREKVWWGAGVRGGKNTHYFKVDYGQRLIYVMGFPAQDVILTYTSSGIDLYAPTFIPLEMVAAIRAYVMWENDKYNPDVPFNQKVLNEQYFHQERRQLASLRWPTAEQWADVIRKTYSRAVIR